MAVFIDRNVPHRFLFPQLYRTCLPDDFSFSHFRAFKSDIPNRDRNTMIFHTPRQKMQKSTEPHAAEPAILQHTIRSAWPDKRDSHMLG